MTLYQKAALGTELRLDGTSLTGTPVLMGTLIQEATVLIFNNASNQTVFFADNTGTTDGVTLDAGDVFVLDLSTNADKAAQTLNFQKGTGIYATGTVGTGQVRVGVVYKR